MHYIDQLIHWISTHPDYALIITFLVACAESLIVIGGLIPGSLALSGIGMLAGSGVIAIYPPLGMAILGAIVGDTLSFFVGRVFKSNLKKLFIFARYPQTLAYGQIYFEKHGGKSVFLARFIGPIRAIVPAIAGMMGLSRTSFIIANSSSAIGWSVLFYFPGVFIGMGHEQIRAHFSQIAYAILILLIVPIAAIKLWRYLKQKYAQTSYQRLYPFHRNVYEYLLGIVLAMFFCLSFFIKHCFSPPIWLQDNHIAKLVYAHSLDANNLRHCCLLLILLIVYCLYENKSRCLQSLALMILALFALDHCILTPSAQVAHSMMLYSLNVAGLFFWARLLLSLQSTIGLCLATFIYAFLMSSQYLLNIHYQLDTLSYLAAGLLAGQIGFLHARFISTNTSAPKVWIYIIISLILFELCCMQAIVGKFSTHPQPIALT